jgi:hypothetical protein
MSGWHCADMKYILTKARDGYLKTRDQNISKVDNCVSSGIVEETRLAAEIKLKPLSGKETQASWETILLTNDLIVNTEKYDDKCSYINKQQTQQTTTLNKSTVAKNLLSVRPYHHRLHYKRNNCLNGRSSIISSGRHRGCYTRSAIRGRDRGQFSCSKLRARSQREKHTEFITSTNKNIILDDLTARHLRANDSSKGVQYIHEECIHQRQLRLVLKELKDSFIPAQLKVKYIQATLNIVARLFVESNNQCPLFIPNFLDVMVPEESMVLYSDRPITLLKPTYENKSINISYMGKTGYQYDSLQHLKLLEVAMVGEIRSTYQTIANPDCGQLHPEVRSSPPSRRLSNTIVGETSSTDKRIIKDNTLYVDNIADEYNILPEYIISGLLLSQSQVVQVKILFESIFEVMLSAYVNELIVIMSCILYACHEILYTFISENSALTKIECPVHWSERESTLRKYPHMELRVYSAIHLRTSGVLTESQVNTKLSIKIIYLIKEQQSKDSYLHDRREYPRGVLRVL